MSFQQINKTEKDMSWREQDILLARNAVTTVYFDDTRPNHIVFNNSTGNEFYVGTTPNVSPNFFELIVPPGSTIVLGRPTGVRQIYIWHAGSKDEITRVQSFIDVFNSQSIPQTMNSIVSNLVYGTMDVATLPPLPDGNNKIGRVDAELTGPLVGPKGVLVDIQGGSINIGEVSVSDIVQKQYTHAFHINKSAAGMGMPLQVDSYKNLTIEITSPTAINTSQLSFYGITQNGTKIPLMGVNMSNLNYDVSTTGMNELWQFDITGLYQINVEIQSISNGNITVNAKAVA